MTYPPGEWGKQIKHICEELDGTCEPLNNGHFRVTFPNGNTVYIPGTPSDYRGKKNTIAACERAAGRRLKRQRAGHYTWKRRGRSFARSPRSEKSTVTRRNDEKLRRLAEIDHTIAGWLDHPPTHQRQAEKLLDERAALVDDLTRRGLDVPAHYTEPVTRRR